MKKSILALSTILLVGCAVKLVQPTQTDVERVQSKFPNYTLAELNQGKAEYENRCTECHGLKNPTKFSEEKWKKIVPGMVKKYNTKFPDKQIDTQTKELIQKYVITMGSAPK